MITTEIYSKGLEKKTLFLCNQLLVCLKKPVSLSRYDPKAINKWSDKATVDKPGSTWKFKHTGTSQS